MSSQDIGETHRPSRLDGDLRHANVRLVEVLDCLRGIIRCLVSHVTDASLGDQLHIGNLPTVGGEVFPEISLRDAGWQTLDEDSG